MVVLRCYFGKFSGVELHSKRMVFQQASGPEKPKTDAEKAATLEREKISAIDEAKKQAEGKIGEAETRMKELGGQLDPGVRQELHNYFKSSVHRADLDNDGSIKPYEVQKFAEVMLAQTKEIIKQYAPTEAEFTKLKEAKEKQKQAAQNVTTTAKKKVEVSLDKIPDASKVTIAQLADEMDKYSGLNELFQKEVQTSLETVDKIQASIKAYEDARSGFKAVWNLGRKIPGLNAKDEASVSELNQKITEAGLQLQAAQAKLAEKKQELAEYGLKLGEVAGVERTRLMKERDAKAKDIEAKKGKQDATLEANKQKFEAFSKQEEALKNKRKDLIKERLKIEEKKTQVDEHSEAALVHKDEAIKKAKDTATQEIAALEAIKATQLTPEAKAAVEAQLNEVKARLEKTNTVSGLLTDNINAKAQALSRTLGEKEKAVEGSIYNSHTLLREQIEPAIDSSEKTLVFLEQIKGEYISNTDQLKAAYDKKIDSVNKMDIAVDDAVLQSTLANSQSLNNLNTASEQLAKVNVTADGVLGAGWRAIANVWEGGLGGLGKGLGTLGEGIMEQGNFITQAAYASDSAFVKYVGGTLANGVAFCTGAVGAVPKLAGDVLVLFSNPAHSAKGLGALLSRDPETGEWWSDKNVGRKAWGNMISFIFAADEFEKGNYGTGLGKVAVNIGTFFMGGGEAGVFAKAGNASKLAKASALAKATAKVAGVGEELGFLARMGVRSAETFAFFKTAGVGMVKSTLQAPGKALKGTKNLATKAKDGLVAGGKAVAKKPSLLLTAPVVGTAKLLWGATKLAKDVVIYGVTLPIRAIRTVSRLANGLKSEARLANAAKILAEEAGNLTKLDEAIAKAYRENPQLADLAKSSPEQALTEALKIINETNPELVTSYFKAQAATEQLQKASKAWAEEAGKAIKKAKEEPGLAKTVNEYKGLQERAKGGDMEAQRALADFEKDASKMEQIKRFEELEAAEKNLGALAKEQETLAKDYARGNYDDAVTLDNALKEAENPVLTSDANLQANFDALKAAMKSGSEEAIQKARNAFGKVDEKVGELIQKVIDGKRVTFDAFKKAYRQHQLNLLDMVKQFSEAFMKGDLKLMAQIKAANPAWAKALEQGVARDAFLNQNAVISRQIGEEKVKAEMKDVLKDARTAQEAADALEKQYGGMKFENGQMHTKIGSEIEIGGQKYQVRMSDTGKVELVDSAGQVVESSQAAKLAAKEAAKQQKAAARAAKKAAKNAAPQPTVTAAPSVQPAIVGPSSRSIPNVEIPTRDFAYGDVLRDFTKSPNPALNKVKDLFQYIKDKRIAATQTAQEAAIIILDDLKTLKFDSAVGETVAEITTADGVLKVKVNATGELEFGVVKGSVETPVHVGTSIERQAAQYAIEAAKKNPDPLILIAEGEKLLKDVAQERTAALATESAEQAATVIAEDLKGLPFNELKQATPYQQIAVKDGTLSLYVKNGKVEFTFTPKSAVEVPVTIPSTKPSVAPLQDASFKKFVSDYEATLIDTSATAAERAVAGKNVLYDVHANRNAGPLSVETLSAEEAAAVVAEDLKGLEFRDIPDGTVVGDIGLNDGVLTLKIKNGKVEFTFTPNVPKEVPVVLRNSRNAKTIISGPSGTPVSLTDARTAVSDSKQALKDAEKALSDAKKAHNNAAKRGEPDLTPFEDAVEKAQQTVDAEKQALTDAQAELRGAEARQKNTVDTRRDAARSAERELGEKRKELEGVKKEIATLNNKISKNPTNTADLILERDGLVTKKNALDAEVTTLENNLATRQAEVRDVLGSGVAKRIESVREWLYEGSAKPSGALQFVKDQLSALSSKVEFVKASGKLLEWMKQNALNPIVQKSLEDLTLREMLMLSALNESAGNGVQKLSVAEITKMSLATRINILEKDLNQLAKIKSNTLPRGAQANTAVATAGSPAQGAAPGTPANAPGGNVVPGGRFGLGGGATPDEKTPVEKAPAGKVGVGGGAGGSGNGNGAGVENGTPTVPGNRFGLGVAGNRRVDSARTFERYNYEKPVAEKKTEGGTAVYRLVDFAINAAKQDAESTLPLEQRIISRLSQGAKDAMPDKVIATAADGSKVTITRHEDTAGKISFSARVEGVAGESGDKRYAANDKKAKQAPKGKQPADDDDDDTV